MLRKKDDGPVLDEVDAQHLATVGKRYDRIAESVPDSFQIREKWDEINKAREKHFSHQGEPEAVQEMRTAMLPLCKTGKAAEATASSKTGKAAEATVSGTPPWGAPAGQKEGSNSSSSKATWKVESKDFVWNSAAPARKIAGFPTVNEAGKESNEKDAKLRMSALPETRHCKASVH